MMVTYTQVDNGFVLRLRHLEDLKNNLVCYPEYLSGLDQQNRGGVRGRKNYDDLLWKVTKLSCSLER